MQSDNRPVIDLDKLERSAFERFLSIVSILLFAGSIVFSLVIWKHLPDKVPVHYGFSGEVNRWGSKWELVILPLISIMLYIFMRGLGKYPHIHNYPIKITEENAKDAYRISRSLMFVLGDIILIVFTIIFINSIVVALGWSEGLGFYLLPLLLLGTFIPIIWALVKLFQLNK